MLLRVKSLILWHTRIDVDNLFGEKLDELCAFIDAREKNRGGRPGYKAWNKLMLNLRTYLEATGRPASAWKDKTRPEKGYKGLFVRFATIVDDATAASAFTEPRSNSALGSALEGLLRTRRKRKPRTP